MPTVIHSGFSSDNLMFDHKSRRNEKHPDYQLHMHDHLELFFLKKGNVTYQTDKQRYTLVPNSLVITRPFEMHAIQIHDLLDYERYVILVNENQIGTDFYDMLINDVTVIPFEGNQNISDLFQKLDYYRHHLTGAGLHTVLANLTEEIICNAGLASQVLSKPNSEVILPPNGNPLLQQALTYMNHHLTDHITVDDICRNLYISKGHLHRLFVTHLKTSPKQYILHQKLALAQKEIDLGKPITAAAEHYGFPNYSTFYKAYKKHFGHAPSAPKEELT